MQSKIKIPKRSRDHILVLKGGNSVERPVSLNSGAAVEVALREAGYRVRAYDFTGEVAALVHELTHSRPDAVFNALHGKYGEDGAIQGLLNLLQIPYSHSGALSSAMAMDKPVARRLFTLAGLRVADGLVMGRDEFLAILAQGKDPIARPYVIKPIAEGSSFGVTLVKAGDNSLPISSKDWQYGEKILIETYIPGRELTVAVIGEGEGATALGAIEIHPSSGFFDYESKYSAGGAIHILPPTLSKRDLSRLYEIGVIAHQTLGCRGVTRADLRFNDAEMANGKADIVILEVNSQPGMTNLSLVPEIAAAAGISFAQLATWLVEEARCE